MRLGGAAVGLVLVRRPLPLAEQGHGEDGRVYCCVHRHASGGRSPLAQRQRRCRLGGGVLGGVLRQTEVEVGNVPVHPAPAHQSQGAGEGQADATKRRRRESGGLRPVTARSEGRAKPKRDRPPALAAACSRPAHPRQQPRGTSLPRRRRALAPQPPPRWPVRAAACAPGARARALLMHDLDTPVQKTPRLQSTILF